MTSEASCLVSVRRDPTKEGAEASAKQAAHPEDCAACGKAVFIKGYCPKHLVRAQQVKKRFRARVKKAEAETKAAGGICML